MKYIFAFLLTSFFAFKACAVTIRFSNPEAVIAQESITQKARAKKLLKLEFTLAIDQAAQNGILIHPNSYAANLVVDRVIQTRTIKKLKNCSSSFSTYNQLKPFFDFHQKIQKNEMMARERKFAATQRANLERAGVAQTMYHGTLD